MQLHNRLSDAVIAVVFKILPHTLVLLPWTMLTAIAAFLLHAIMLAGNLPDHEAAAIGLGSIHAL